MPFTTLDTLRTALQRRDVPTLVFWNRLEGLPRAKSFDRALRAEVRDALWMVTKQWQIGEFIGDDAGSPLGAQVQIDTTHLDRVTIGGTSAAHDDDTPLEATVERQRIQLTRGAGKIQLDLRVQLGRHWNKLLGASGLGDYHAAFRAKYPFALPPRDRSDAAADIYAHPAAWQRVAALAGRATDGGDLYLYLTADAAHHASDGIVLADVAHGSALDGLGDRLVAWFDDLYFQPSSTAAGAWQAEALEYKFSCSAPAASGETQLIADQYPGGHLDWYSFDVNARTGTRLVLQGGHASGTSVSPKQPTRRLPSYTRSFLPSQLMFDGMPNTRWWKFEESKVRFGGVTPATTDIAKLLLVEFGLVYANDWFLIPFTLSAGSLATIKQMTVTNSFGERFLIEAAGAGVENAWQEWRMFSLSARNTVAADTTMFLAPAVPKIQDGPPLDEINFVRDEMANMVWAIETMAPMVTGTSRVGSEIARETAAYHRHEIGMAPAPSPYKAPIYYDVMTPVPENWIPLVPTHVANSDREVELQRAGVLRLIDGDPQSPVRIEPATALLRRGRDQLPTQPMFVHEEEVPRSGTELTRAFQRTRWRGGRTFVWLSIAKETGRGGDRSGLAFDAIANPRHAPSAS
jgi:hypothetical protein